MYDDIQEEILREIKDLYVDCPECECMEDGQYCCSTCNCQGGEGRINVYQYLKEYFKRS